MAFTGGRGEPVESVELAGGELYAVRGRVLLDSGDATGALDLLASWATTPRVAHYQTAVDDIS